MKNPLKVQTCILFRQTGRIGEDKMQYVLDTHRERLTDCWSDRQEQKRIIKCVFF